MDPQNGVSPRGSLHFHSAGVTFQHLPDPIIIQRSLDELLQTDDGYRQNKDRRHYRHRMLQVLILEGKSLLFVNVS